MTDEQYEILKSCMKKPQSFKRLLEIHRLDYDRFVRIFDPNVQTYFEINSFSAEWNE